LTNYRFRTISFLSDYGLVDEFVGVCHGVMLRIAPEVTVIDVCHGIRPQNIAEGASVLAQAVPYLPTGVHLAIVDPGVGSGRLPIAVQAADGSWLVGPDNGLLIPAAARLGGATSVRKLENPELRAPHPSRTFHGRDVFAPAAAHLARGVPPEELGGELPVERCVSLRVAVPRLHDGHFHAAVTKVDRFGNLSLNVDAVVAAEVGIVVGTLLDVGVEGHRLLIPFGEAFGSVAPAEPVVTEDSHGQLAVSVNLGSAADRFGASLGSKVLIGPAGSVGGG
jgi:S-adenosyl-L-methionine hydrolase (adenosine-forming)